jgi:hypothetical protein
MYGSPHRPCVDGDLVGIRGSVGAIPIEPARYARAESLSVQSLRPTFELLVERLFESLLRMRDSARF